MKHKHKISVLFLSFFFAAVMAFGCSNPGDIDEVNKEIGPPTEDVVTNLPEGETCGDRRLCAEGLVCKPPVTEQDTKFPSKFV